MTPEEEELAQQIKAMAFLDELSSYSPRCSASYLQVLASWHSLLKLLCQPHAPIGKAHVMDLEQHVQCLWNALVAQLAAVAVMAAPETLNDDDDLELEAGPLFLNALYASLIGVAIVLVGCRMSFLLSGPAGRAHSTSEGSPDQLLGFDWACECVRGRVFIRSRAGNVPLLSRCLQSSLGWMIALVVYVVSCVVAAYFTIGATLHKIMFVFACWGTAQLTTWILIEPLALAFVTVALSVMGIGTAGAMAPTKPAVRWRAAGAALRIRAAPKNKYQVHPTH
jgi:hypothetical protein